MGRFSAVADRGREGNRGRKGRKEVKHPGRNRTMDKEISKTLR